MNACREETIAFRITGLREDQVAQLQELYDPDSYNIEKSYKSMALYAASFPLSEDFDYGGLKKFLAENSAAVLSYGLHVSIVSDKDHDGVALPDYALAAHRDMGGSIDFSYACFSG